MQEHVNAMTRPIIYPFSYGTVLTGNLDVYHILYTHLIRASMDSPVSSHTAGPLSLSGGHTLGVP